MKLAGFVEGSNPTLLGRSQNSIPQVKGISCITGRSLSSCESLETSPVVFVIRVLRLSARDSLLTCDLCAGITRTSKFLFPPLVSPAGLDRLGKAAYVIMWCTESHRMTRV